MLTIEEARKEAAALAAAGYAAVVIHAPTWRDDFDDDAHAYTYQAADYALSAGEVIVETYPATGTPAYITATEADIIAGWCEAYGAETDDDRGLVARCYRKARETGLSIGLIFAEAERAGRIGGAEERARAAACRRMLDYAASR